MENLHEEEAPDEAAMMMDVEEATVHTDRIQEDSKASAEQIQEFAERI